MWAVFLLSSLSVAIVALAFVYIANKVIIKMKNDRIENQKKYKGENENE
jgi:hypothetical protein